MLRKLGQVGGLLLVVGVVAWRFYPELPGVSSVPVAEEPWQLAVPPRADLKKAASLLTSTAMWGNVEIKKTEDAIEQNPPWRLLAIMTAGNEKHVLIDVEKQPNRQLRVGDRLPGDFEIVGISVDSVCVLVNGKKRQLPIYPQGKQLL